MITLKGTTVSIESNTKECKPSKKLKQLAQEIKEMSNNPKWIEYLTNFDDNSYSQNGKQKGRGMSKNGKG